MNKILFISFLITIMISNMGLIEAFCISISDCESQAAEPDCHCTNCASPTLPNPDKSKCCSLITNCGTYSFDCWTCATCTSPAVPNLDKSKCCSLITSCGTYAADCSCATCTLPTLANLDKSKCCYMDLNCGTYGYDCTCTTCTYPMVFNSDKSKCCYVITNCEVYSADCACSTCTSPAVLNSYKSKCCTEILWCMFYGADCTCTTCTYLAVFNSDKSKCCYVITNCETYSTDCRCTTCTYPTLANLDKLKCCSEISNCGTYGTDCMCTTCTSPARLNYENSKCCVEISNCGIYGIDCTCITCTSPSRINSDYSKCCVEISNCLKYGSDCRCTTCISPTVSNSDKSKCCTVMVSCGTYTHDCTCIFCIEPSVTSNDRSKCCAQIFNCGVYSSDCSCNNCLPPTVFNFDNSKCCTPIINCLKFSNDCTCSSCTDSKIANIDKSKCCSEIMNCAVYSSDCNCYSCSANSIINLSKTKCCDSIIPNCGIYENDCNTCSSCKVSALFNSDKSKCCNSISNCGIIDNDCLCLFCTTPNFKANNMKTKCCSSIINCEFYGIDCTCSSCSFPSVLNSDKSKCCSPITDCELYQIDCTCTAKSVLNCPSNCAKCHSNIFDQIICNECVDGYYLKETCIKQNFAISLNDGMIIQIYNFFNKACLTSENKFKNCNSVPTLDTLFKLNKINENLFTVTSVLNSKNLYSKCFEKFKEYSLDYNYGENYEFNEICNKLFTINNCLTDFKESENAEICQRNYVNLTSLWFFNTLNNGFKYEHDAVSFLIKNNELNNLCLSNMDGYANLKACNEGDFLSKFGLNQIDNLGKTVNNPIKSELIVLSDIIKIKWTNPKININTIYIIYYYDQNIDFNSYICGTDRSNSPITFNEYVNEIGNNIVETNLTFNDLKKCGVKTFEDDNYLHFIMSIITYNSQNNIGFSDYYDLIFKKTANFNELVYVGNGTKSESQIINDKHSSVLIDVSKSLTVNFRSLIENQFIQKNMSQTLVINYESSNKFTLNVLNKILIFSSVNKTIYIDASFKNDIPNEITIYFDLSSLPSNYYTLKFSIYFQLISRILTQNYENTNNFISLYEIPNKLFIGNKEEIEVKISDLNNSDNKDDDEKTLIIVAALLGVFGLIFIILGSIWIFKRINKKKQIQKNQYKLPIEITDTNKNY